MGAVAPIRRLLGLLAAAHVREGRCWGELILLTSLTSILDALSFFDGLLS